MKTPISSIPVVLLQPPTTCRDFTRSSSLYPPLGLCVLAATVHPSQCTVIDADALGFNEDQAVSAVLGFSPKAVGMTVTSYTLDLVERYAARFAEHGILVIVGGPHATLAPADTLQRCPSVDVLVRGDGERVFPELVDRVGAGTSLQGLPGVYTRDSAEGPLSVGVLRTTDLSVVPMPRFDGLPVHSYWCPDAKLRPMVTMLTSRGCPHRCGFCGSPALFGRKLLTYPTEMVLTHLEYLRDELGVREVSFVDDSFTINKRRTIELCDQMIERRLELTWFANVRADQVNEDVARKMALAGCHQVYLGFESGNPGILARVNKGETVAQLEHGADVLADAGIERSVGFVIGLPGESDGTVEDSIALAQRVRPERLQFTRFTPLVGSPLFEGSTAQSGFHLVGDDQVGAWIGHCYTECKADDWGKESW